MTSNANPVLLTEETYTSYVSCRDCDYRPRTGTPVATARNHAMKNPGHRARVQSFADETFVCGGLAASKPTPDDGPTFSASEL